MLSPAARPTLCAWTTGPFDLVYVPGAFSHVDLIAEHPRLAAYFDAMSSFARVITFDKRGTGASDRLTGIADLETRMDDVRAVRTTSIPSGRRSWAFRRAGL